MSLRQAAQQALEAYDLHEPLAVVMEALRTALSEPDQKPVAWLLSVDIVNYQGQSEYRTVLAFRPDPAVTGNYEVNEVISAQPLYTTPPAAPVQEPVALENVYETIIHWDEGGGKRSRRELARRIVALYTHPSQRKPLTDEQIVSVMRSLGWTGKAPSDINFARAIEAAHGIGEKK